MLNVGDRVFCKYFYREDFIGKLGTVVSIINEIVLVKFDFQFSPLLHNAISYDQNLYYYLRLSDLDALNMEEFNYGNLDRENWWED